MQHKIEVILGNSNKRFSGVTSTMLQILPWQNEITPTAVLGSHHLPQGATFLNHREFIRLCRQPLSDGRFRIFHARRNDEMIQGIIAKKVFGAKIHLVFTSMAQRYHSRFTRLLMRQMDGIISSCSKSASFLANPPDRIIPLGVNMESFSPAENRAEAWKKLGFPGDFGIGIFGRVRPSKGVDILVEATLPIMAEFPGMTVVICGETTPKYHGYKEELEKKIKAAGFAERFLFLGKRPFSELPSLFRSMTIVTALSRNEGYGLTALEAMASATPVITSDAGAWEDIVRNGMDGYCLPAGDVFAVTEKIKSLLNLPPERINQMGADARKRVATEFTVQLEAERLCRFYRELQIKNFKQNPGCLDPTSRC